MASIPVVLSISATMGRMEALASWSRTDATFAGETREVYRKGAGRGVVIIHEFPGIEENLIRFADDVVEAGFTVLLPRLFGTPGAGLSLPNVAGDLRQFCVRREFSIFARGRTSPVAGWLRGLADKLHAEVGGDGIGVIGMCFSGGLALAMMAGAPVIAPVIAEPSLPAAVGLPRGARARAADLGLSAGDFEAVKSSGCEVLGLKYRTDAASGTRFDTLRRELGERFLAVEFEGPGHSVLTAHRREFGVDEVLDFLDRTLNEQPTRTPAARDQPMEEELQSRLGPGFEARVSHDPERVALLVERGLTRKGLERARAICREVTGSAPDIARLRPPRS
jgi:dienelactone hydrolase